MQKVKLKKAIESHYKQFSLREAQLQRLEAQLEQKKTIAFLKPAHYAKLVIAASIIFVISFLLPHDHTEDIAYEIAKNHLKNMPMELKTDSYSMVNQSLHRLSFSVVESKIILAKNLQLIGARYCSIQGKLAAQLQFKDPKTNKVYTLYQVPKSEDLQDLKEAVVQMKVSDVSVELWEEQGLLLGLASL